MAEEEQDEAEQEPDAAATAAAAQKKKKLMMLGGLIAALLLVSGGGTWALLHFLADEDPAAQQATADAPAEEGEEEPAAPAEPTRAQAQYLQLEPTFLANYMVKGRQHYLQLAVAVMTRDEAALKAMHEHMPLIRNRLVMLLSGEVFETLQTDEGRLRLQEKLLAAIQEILQKETGHGGVEQVLFTNFVMT
jgi:flagellar protein FliL